MQTDSLGQAVQLLDTISPEHDTAAAAKLTFYYTPEIASLVASMY